MTTKQIQILKDIVFPHLPEYACPTIQTHYLNISTVYPKGINGENLTEMALAHVGGYKFVDLATMDFDDIDQSDSKTTSVNVKTKRVEVTSIEKKVGALRISIYNPFVSRMDYMFMPYDEWQSLAIRCHGKNKDDKLRLAMSWNEKGDHYNQYNKFQLSSFIELATMTEALFYQKHYGSSPIPEILYKPNPPSTFLQLFG